MLNKLFAKPLKRQGLPRLLMPAPGALNPHAIGLLSIAVAGAIAWHLLREPSQAEILNNAADHIDYSYDLIVSQPATSPDRRRDLKILVEYRDYMKTQAQTAESECLAGVATLLASQAQQLLDLSAPKAAGPIDLDMARPAIRSAEAKRRLADCPH